MTDILNYIKINENVATSGQPSKEEFEDINSNGFEVVINLALCDATNALENEDKIVTNLGMTYIHIPVKFDEPKVSQAELFLKTMQGLQGSKVWIHCSMNYRVTAFMYTYHKHVLLTPFEDIDLSMFEQWSPTLKWQNIIKHDYTGCCT